MLRELAEGMYSGFRNDIHDKYKLHKLRWLRNKTYSEQYSPFRQLKTTADSVLEKECVQSRDFVQSCILLTSSLGRPSLLVTPSARGSSGLRSSTRLLMCTMEYVNCTQLEETNVD